MANFADLYYNGNTKRLDELIASASKRKLSLIQKMVESLSDDAIIKFLGTHFVSSMIFVSSVRVNYGALGYVGDGETNIDFTFDHLEDKIPDYMHEVLDTIKENLNLYDHCDVSFYSTGTDIVVKLMDYEIEYLDDWRYQDLYSSKIESAWLADIFDRLIVSRFDDILELAKGDLYEVLQSCIYDFIDIVKRNDPLTIYDLKSYEDRVRAIDVYLQLLQNKGEETNDSNNQTTAGN